MAARRWHAGKAERKEWVEKQINMASRGENQFLILFHFKAINNLGNSIH
jgi:hypothetical protein